MKVFALEFPLHKPGIELIHHTLFHGVEGTPLTTRVAGPVMGDPVEPLELVHNARRVPAIFSPTRASLVVGSAVAERLVGVPNTALRSVRFHRLVDFPPISPGDDSYKESAAYRRAVESPGGIERLFDHLPTAAPALAAAVDRYFEVVPTLLKDAAAAFPDARRAPYARPFTIDRTNELLLSPALVEDYPLTWWGQYVLHERVFRILEPHLDPAYAEVVEINL